MALYHKHRPQLWHDIIGQDTIVSTIQNQIKQGKPAHAYLLSGPRGVGKTTTARLIAKTLNCTERPNDSAEPCNTCSSCQDITNSAALDVIEIDAASHTGVDMVREVIIESAEFQPTKSKYKIFIIDEVHMLSTSAFNALLKTLEEPPVYAIFILATTELQKLPATIISRCQRYIFKKIPRELMLERLKSIAKAEKIKIDGEVLGRLIKKSEGSARDAVSLLDQVMAIAGDTITEADVQLLLPSTPAESQLALARALAENDVPAGLHLIKSVIGQGIHPAQFLSDFIEYTRGLLLMHFDEQLAVKEMDIPSATAADIKPILLQLPAERLLYILDRAFKRYQDARFATIPELPLELFLIECCGNMPATPAPAAAAQPAEVKPKAGVKKEMPPATFDKSAVEKAWGTFMANLETSQPSLVFLLRMAELKNVSGNTLTLAVQYPFHQNKLTERTTKKNLEDQLSDLLGGRVILQIEVHEQAGAQNTAALNDLAAAFGGEVV